jgi:hypothetical protein
VFPKIALRVITLWFVFEKISGSDPFHPMHDSLSRKIETMQQKGTEVVAPAKEPVKVNIEIISSS